MPTNRELVAIINGLAGANRRGLVLYGTPPDRAEAYNMALVDVLISIDEVESSLKLQSNMSKHLNGGDKP